MSDIQKVMTALVLVMRVLVLLELIQQSNFKVLFWNFFLCNPLDLHEAYHSMSLSVL